MSMANATVRLIQVLSLRMILAVVLMIVPAFLLIALALA